MNIWESKKKIVGIICAAIVLALPAGVTAQSAGPALTYEQLMQSPEKYVGKRVRVDGIWVYGFEWSYLCSLECNQRHAVWIDVVNEGSLCKRGRRKIKRLGKKFDNKARVRLTGMLESGGGYGHMGAYPFRFVAVCVERFEKIY